MRLERRIEWSGAGATLATVDKLADWKRHCEQGHLPWRRDCLACLESASYMRPHRRQRHPVVLNMMADLAGPYKEGEDVEVTKGRYILLVVYPFPQWVREPATEDAPIPEEWYEEEELAHASDVEPTDGGDPFMEEPPEASMDPSVKEKDLADKDSDRWASVVDTLKRPYKVINLCFVEILPNKRPTTVTAGLSRVYSRLRSDGFPVYGLFTDRGGEMVNSTVRTWCKARSILRKTTAPESPASNGRTERLLGLIRREARALLSASSLEARMWPHAVRHATEQRHRKGMAMLAYPVKPMVPFWARVTIRARTWNDKKWSTRAVNGHVATPSSEVEGGWVIRVQAPEGIRFYVSTLLYLNAQPPLQPPDLTRPDFTRPALDGSADTTYPSPVHRHRHKSPVGEGRTSTSRAMPVVELEAPAVTKEPGTRLIGVVPTHRHTKKGLAGSSEGESPAVGSSRVPGSFVESLAAGSGLHVRALAAARALDQLGVVDKTVIEEQSLAV